MSKPKHTRNHNVRQVLAYQFDNFFLKKDEMLKRIEENTSRGGSISNSDSQPLGCGPFEGQMTLSQGPPKTIYIVVHNSRKIIVMK